MKVTKRDGAVNRSILIGLVTNKAVCGNVAARWDSENPLFGSRWENLIASWCVGYFNKYCKPPGERIEHRFARWAESGGRDRETVKAVESFLEGLSGDYERQRKKVNAEYVLDQAGELFTRVRLEQLRDEIEGHLEYGDLDKARAAVEGFRPVELGTGVGIDLLADEAAVSAAFEEEFTDIITFEDGLGAFFKGMLGRDCFISFMGKAKIGKTFWLEHFVFAGLSAGLNVAYFEAGDLSKNQVIRRVGSRAARRPIKPQKYHLPTDIILGGAGEPPRVEFERKHFADPLTKDLAWKHIRKLGKRYGPDRLKLSVHPNGSVSARGIDNILDTWGRDDWNADLVVIDYADILDHSSDPHAEGRDRINATWMALRALSVRRHCLVVTATQSDADSYDAVNLKRKHFTDDRRKNDHVTAMVAINQTEAEKRREDCPVYRLGIVHGRDLDYNDEIQCYTAACLPISNPAVRSILVEEGDAEG